MTRFQSNNIRYGSGSWAQDVRSQGGGCQGSDGAGLKGEKDERVSDSEGGPLDAMGPRNSSFLDSEYSAICWAFLNIYWMGSFAIPGHNNQVAVRVRS